MQLGMAGLGRMGANMVWRLIQNGHDCVVFDTSPRTVSDFVKENAVGAATGMMLLASSEGLHAHRSRCQD